jgi:F-type H+/Na+-transporting ATPase subunit alpha
MTELNEYMDARHSDVLKTIREKKDLTDDVKAALDRALAEFADVFRPTKAPEGKAA